jgi:hypothetical protein
MPIDELQRGAAHLSRGVSIKGSVKFLNELLLDGEVEGTIKFRSRSHDAVIRAYDSPSLNPNNSAQSSPGTHCAFVQFSTEGRVIAPPFISFCDCCVETKSGTIRST